MKILLLSHNFAPFIGGIEVMSEMLCTSFVKAGHEVHVMTWTPGPDNDQTLYRIIRVPSKMKLISEHKWADLIFENNPSLRLSWPRVFIKRPSVVVLQTWIARLDGQIAFQDRVKKYWLEKSSHVIACSNALREGCYPKATVIGNPYRSEVFQIMPEVKRDKDFVFLGRLVSDKGAIMAIHALNYFIKNYNSTDNSINQPVLTIIGDGPERLTLELEAKKLNLEKNVRFTGALEGMDLVACLNEHQFQLVPSTWKEPFGIAALEGIACGCIPIVADGGGLPDAVGNAGKTFKRGNTDSLIQALKDIKSDSDLEDKLLNAATSHLDQFKPERIMAQYLTIVESVYQAKS